MTPVIEQYGMRQTMCRGRNQFGMLFDWQADQCLDAPAFGVTGAHLHSDGEHFRAYALGPISSEEFMR